VTKPGSRALIFVLTLRAPPGAAGIRALRRALKALLRRYKLRCLAIEERGEQ
jgi:hypothetical protein